MSASSAGGAQIKPNKIIIIEKTHQSSKGEGLLYTIGYPGIIGCIGFS